jgi:hypothetical protein
MKTGLLRVGLDKMFSGFMSACIIPLEARTTDLKSLQRECIFPLRTGCNHCKSQYQILNDSKVKDHTRGQNIFLIQSIISACFKNFQ